MPRHSEDPSLIVVADDYGYAPAYDEGILEAAAAQAIDAVSVMILRDPDPTPLLASGVGVGLHLESVSQAPLEAQLARFEALFRRGPAHIDGHHHCHAESGRVALSVARSGRRLGIRVRSVSPRHRRLLRCLGVRTNDRLIGRMSEDEPPVPAEIAAWAEGGGLPSGLTEWMVHPGRAGAAGGSRYDAGRAEDLRLLLELASDDRLRRLRARHGPG